jgi:hypothetical protein
MESTETNTESNTESNTDAIGDQDEQESTNEEQTEPEQATYTKGVQKRIDELTKAKHDERRERRAAQERADRLEYELSQLRSGGKTGNTGAPDPDKYPAGKYDPDYLEALTDYKVELKITERLAKKELENKKSSLQKVESAILEKYPDYNEVSKDFLAHPLANVKAFTNLVFESDNPVDMAYYLGKHEDELDKIARMDEVQAARYIGKLESKLATPPEPPKKVSSARPISPIGASGGSHVQKDPSEMTMAEFAAWDKAKQRAKFNRMRS